MKRLFVFTGLALLLATASLADKGDHALYLGISYSIIAGPDEAQNLIGGGFGFKGGIGFGLNPQTELIVNMQYTGFPLKREGYLDKLEENLNGSLTVPRSEISMSGGNIQAYGIMVDLKHTLPSEAPDTTVYPYLIAGLGFFHFENPDKVTLSAPDYYDLVIPSSEMGEPSTDPAVSLGLGVDIEMSNSTSLILEGRYMVVFNHNYPENDGNSKLFNISGALRILLGK